MSDKVEEKMKEYAKMFGDGFPTIPLAWGREDKEIIAIIDECLRKKKDVYQLGYVEISEDIYY